MKARKDATERSDTSTSVSERNKTQSVDDGGAAFPVVTTDGPLGCAGSWRPGPGMSLRDWFAGMALAVYRPLDGDWTPRELAELAYQQADEMITEKRRREAQT